MSSNPIYWNKVKCIHPITEVFLGLCTRICIHRCSWACGKVNFVKWSLQIGMRIRAPMQDGVRRRGCCCGAPRTSCRNNTEPFFYTAAKGAGLPGNFNSRCRLSIFACNVCSGVIYLSKKWWCVSTVQRSEDYFPIASFRLMMFLVY